MSEITESFDYIIVGAGSAGCVLANRLTEDENTSVLLLENGGSDKSIFSSINGMVYVRGHARDYDEWEAHGAKDWSYKHCLPYFKKAETWAFGADEYRGGEGNLGTNNGNNMQNPLYKAFVDAGVEAGYLATEDYNGAQQEGFGAMHMTVKDGRRSSARSHFICGFGGFTSFITIIGNWCS